MHWYARPTGRRRFQHGSRAYLQKYSLQGTVQTNDLQATSRRPINSEAFCESKEEISTMPG